MGKTSEAIFSLKPVIFQYKNDKTDTPQFGLVAEEVAKINSALITLDKEGKPYSVRYDKVDAMLLNEFLKEHRKVQEQQKEIDSLKAELTEQRDLIQKVSDRVEMSKPAAQVVASNQ
jgi:predicted RNase H-like nuclease (RuvC/YqgF family)